MTDSEVVRYLPGEKVTVEVLADSGGAVATKQDLVEIDGESDGMTQVVGIQAQGNESVALLVTEPRDLADPDVSASDIAAGESAGTATAILAKPVYNLVASSGYTPSVADLVQETTDGIEAYAGAATQATTPKGIVFETQAHDFGHGDGVGVAVFR